MAGGGAARGRGGGGGGGGGGKGTARAGQSPPGNATARRAGAGRSKRGAAGGGPSSRPAKRGGKGTGAARKGGGSSRSHPSLDIVESRGAELSGKRVVLCVSGSVAAYKAIELARLLMRHGADVTCVASAAATRLVRPEYFRWATGRAAVTRLTGELEHIRLADYGGSDAIVAYPATANTIGKLANGIDDAPVPTVLTVGLGAGIPIVAGLAMHESMYRNAAVCRNVAFLEERGVEFVAPALEEGKARAPEPEEMLRRVVGRLGGGGGALRGRRALLTAGPTSEPIDPVRSITSASTGATGMLLARELASAGCEVTVVYGPGREEPPAGARVVRVTTVREMDAAVRREMGRRKFDIVVMAAAAADYTVRSPRAAKIKSSARTLTVRLERAPKIIDSARAAQPGALLVGFKAEAGVGRGELERRALARMRRAGADMMVANAVGTPRHARDPGSSSASILAAGKGPRRTGWVPKERIAAAIRAEIEKRLAERDGGGGGAADKAGSRGRRRVARRHG